MEGLSIFCLQNLNPWEGKNYSNIILTIKVTNYTRKYNLDIKDLIIYLLCSIIYGAQSAFSEAHFLCLLRLS